MNVNEFTKVFPLGTHLCREPMPPMAELKADMENLKRRGFNLVKLQEHWMVDEPVEGQCDFSRCEELIAHAADLDLGVYLGLTCEQAPGWLWRKHPDCRMQRRDGSPVAYEAQTTLPADGKPGPCFDHPGAMADQLRFIGQLVARLGTYENVVVWNTWQEVSYWGETYAGGEVCYCDHTLAHFRAWLQEKHGDLDALNRVWNTRYGDWQSVLPERCPATYPVAQAAAWRYFMDNVQIGAVLEARAAAIREADPLGRPVFAHLASPVIGSGAAWSQARRQDFLGSSCYPAWSSLQPWDDGYPPGPEGYPRHDALLAETWDAVALRFDYVRSLNPAGTPVWAAEFQGGPVSTGFHKGRVPSAADMRRWILTAIGSGITALSFWVTRAEQMLAEMNGFSLLDSQGDRTDRLDEAERIGRALNRFPEIFARPTAPRGRVAILVDEEKHQLWRLVSDGSQHLPYDLRGWYRLFWDAGVPVDFIEAGQLDDEGSAYQAIIAPFPVVMGEPVAASLASYVENGGHLVCEAAPGRTNAEGFCARGELSPRMRELFGVDHASFTMVREPGGDARWSPRERTWGEYLDPTMLEGVGALAGHRLRANVYVETYTCTGGEPALTSGGAVAGVHNRVGDGSAWLLGTFVGHSGTAYRDADTAAALASLLSACGVEDDCCGRLLRRRRVTATNEAWVLFNPTREAVTETISMAGWTGVEDLLGAPLSRHGHDVELVVESLDARVLIVR